MNGYEVGDARFRSPVKDGLYDAVKYNVTEEFFINLTPHEVVIRGVKIPPSGNIARIEEVYDSAGRTFAGIPIKTRSYRNLAGLPKEKPGVGYIVSGLVAESSACRHRQDVFCPGEMIRDEKGNVIGAKSLVSYA